MGLRLDINVVVKSLEAQGQRMEQGFADLRRETTEFKTDINRLFTESRREMTDLKTDTNRQFSDLRQDMAELRTTPQRQMWVLIGVVLVTLVSVMIKLTFFPSQGLGTMPFGLCGGVRIK